MTIPKSTKSNVTAFLKEELEKAGVKTRLCASLDTPSGRREVDLFCENTGSYTCDAKFTERNLLDAISKIQNDYFRYHEELGIKGGFAILYPDELAKPLPHDVLKELLKTLKFKVIIMFLPTDTQRNFTMYEGTLPEVAREMAMHILKPPAYVEPNIEWIIKSLRAAATYITDGLKHLTGNQLKDIFGGEHVFRNILQYEREEKYPVEELRLVSAFLLVNQILFYHVLSRKAKFPEIDTGTLTTPSQLTQYFDLVHSKNYRAIFSYDMASKISKDYTAIVKKIINVIKGISPEKIGGDLLGTIFHDLIPLNVRKYVAAFYTNVHAADLLAYLSIDNHDAHVADFAVGSGGLLVAAYRRKKRVLERSKKFHEKYHEDFINQLLGVDVMPFAASVAACHLALQFPEHYTDNANIAIWDSTELQPNLRIPSIADITYVLRGQATRDMSFGEKKLVKGIVKPVNDESEHIILADYDVIMMNPPFTRQERVPDDYKKTLCDRFKPYKEYLHGQLGYYGYFILLADTFLREGGRLAFVLPATFLRVRSARGVINLLSQNYHVEYIITGKKRLNFSESTWRREILLVARKLTDKEKKGDTVFAALEKLPKTEDELERVCRKIKNVSGSYEDHEISAFTIHSSELLKDLDWFRFITPFQRPGLSEVWELISSSAQNLERFGKVYNLKNIMKRGIESRKEVKVQALFIPYSMKRAIRKEDAWILDKIEEKQLIVFNRYFKDKLHIPKNCIVPCLRTMSSNRYMDTSDKTDFVVIRDFPKAHRFFYDERAAFRDILPTWNRYVENRLGNLIILRRFVINAPGTLHLCHYSSAPMTASGTAWVCNVHDEDAKILCLWFNSSINVAQVLDKRIEDIWIDIHKYILRDFYIIDPHELSKEERTKFLDLFHTLSKQKVPSLAEQYTSVPELKKEIDTAILSALGFDDDEIEKILSDLYEALRIEFEALQEIGAIR